MAIQSGRVPMLLLVAGVACVVLSGCSENRNPDEPPASSPVTTRTSTNASPPPAGDVAWMDGLCGIVGDLQRAIWAAPPEQSASNGPELKRFASMMLGAASDSLTDAVRRLGGIGPSPVDGGDRLARELSGKFSDLKKDVDDAKNKVDALADDTTEEEVGGVMGTVWPKVTAMNGDPFKDFGITSAMRTAGRSLACTSITGWPR
ncbi:MAG TPA: hypothetical protein DGT23_35185 [Micromonosporaceae bacterium]|nr:hypothetical protein [Micromonosporaceae bacterium]